MGTLPQEGGVIEKGGDEHNQDDVFEGVQQPPATSRQQAPTATRHRDLLKQ